MNRNAKNRVLASIDEREVVRLTQELVKIPSVNPPGDEKKIAEFLGHYFRGLGLEVEYKDVQPGRPNLLATCRGSDDSPILLYNGHMDVMPPGEGWTIDPFGGEIVEGRIYGRGATDMKGPIAAMVVALKAVKEACGSLKGTLKITGVVGEEADQVGTKQLACDRVKADFAIVGEPTELKPVIAHKGDVYFEVTVKGKAAHGSVPDLGINAISKMCSVIRGIEGLSDRLKEKQHPLVDHPTISIGTIKGGVNTAIVPDLCSISIDRRLIPGETVEEARIEIEDLLNAIEESDPKFHAELTVPMISLAMEISQKEPVVGALRRATAAVLGEDPGVHGFSATCDAAILVNELGIPTAIFGPGSLSGQAHKTDEYIEIEQLVAGAKIYALTLLELLS